MKTINDINLEAGSALAKPMKWHKFLIYFSMWMSSLGAISQGLNFYNGGLYEDPAAVYSCYIGLEKLDTVAGIFYVLLGIFIIVSRFKLARYRENAITWLTWSYILPPVFNIIWLLSFYNVTGVLVPSDLVDWIVGTVVSLSMIIINLIYYKKRKSLFTK